MRANKTEGGSQGRTRGAGLPSVAAALLLSAAWWVAGPAASADAAEALRWKFRAGETLRFAIETKSNMTAKAMGIERKTTQTQTVETSWKVRSVDASGGAEINYRMDRIRLRVEMPPLMPLDYDSANDKGDPPGFEAIARSVRAQVGAELTFKMKPNGEITDIQLPEGTLKKLREATPPGGPEGEISEKTIKEAVLLQSSPPSFPEGPMEAGKSWSPKPTRMPLPFATLVLDKTFTYQGPDPQSPALLLVAVETTAKVEPIEGVDVKATIRKQDGKGTMTFDAQAGRIARTNLTVKMDMSIVQTGQSTEVSSEMTTSMLPLP
jgi:hypothetical protein